MENTFHFLIKMYYEEQKEMSLPTIFGQKWKIKYNTNIKDMNLDS